MRKSDVSDWVEVATLVAAAAVRESRTWPAVDGLRVTVDLHAGGAWIGGTAVGVGVSVDRALLAESAGRALRLAVE